MNYWLMKAHPSWNDWDEMLGNRDKPDLWESYRIPKIMNRGDRVFFWESGTGRRLVALGVVDNPRLRRRSTHGKLLFTVSYLTSRFRVMPGIDELRATPQLAGVSFLKAGPAGTIFPLTVAQATALYRQISSTNDLDVLWPELAGLIVTDVDASAREGDQRFVRHLRRERDPALAEKKKSAFIGQHGKLFCEACGDDLARYRELAKQCFEVHHRKPLSESDVAVETGLDDLAVLCPTCHRAIHRTEPIASVDEFSKQIGRHKLGRVRK